LRVPFGDVTFQFQNVVIDRLSERKKVALGVTGGIAAYKSIEVLRALQRAGCDVRVTMTRHACEFIQPLTFRALSDEYVIVDDYAADNPDPIAHITFSQTVDLFIIAPATANTLGKLANGVADDFVSSTYLACTAPVLIAPAMNTTMWLHPATQRNIQQLRADGVHIIEPDAGEMACGTIGPGRLSEPDRIVAMALQILGQAAESAEGDGDLSEERILITTGATREAIDPVRFISNRSSGRMGFALATAAQRRGARVRVIAGATTVDAPTNIELTQVISAQEMRDEVAREIRDATIFIAAAAVADYRPKVTSNAKIKKSQTELTLDLERTPDILSEAARTRREGQLIIGFAAETNDVFENAQKKMSAKRLDMIIANDVSVQGQGFDAENNRVTILRPDAAPLEVPLMSKLEVADRVLDQIASLRQTNSQSLRLTKTN
jgi:phosphopantothenoylcysteine decarboxylase/phosphopantothenate--cysteine ligase